MLRKYAIFLLPLLLLGCGPRALERPDVPITWGMRLNRPEDAAELNPNLAKLRELVMRNLLLELPLKADSAGLPRVTVDAPGELVGLFLRYRAHLQVAFANTNEQELFPIGRPMDTALWFKTLDAEVRRNLEVLKGASPERVIIGGDMLQVGHAAEEWKTLLENLRKDYPKVAFSVGGRMEFLQNSGLGALSDEVTIDYPPMAGDDVKADCREVNQTLAAFAQSLQKPLYIYRANVIGESATIQFKNRLRFWPDDLNLSGLCLNSLYAKVPPRDTTSYYGLGDERELLDYLDEYRRTAFEQP